MPRKRRQMCPCRPRRACKNLTNTLAISMSHVVQFPDTKKRRGILKQAQRQKKKTINTEHIRERSLTYAHYSGKRAPGNGAELMELQAAKQFRSYDFSTINATKLRHQAVAQLGSSFNSASRGPFFAFPMLPCSFCSPVTWR